MTKAATEVANESPAASKKKSRGSAPMPAPARAALLREIMDRGPGNHRLLRQDSYRQPVGLITAEQIAIAREFGFPFLGAPNPALIVSLCEHVLVLQARLDRLEVKAGIA